MMTTIGELLRNKRNELGLSLDQVSSDLFIKTQYLEALENNQHELLPSDVQGKGFLRLYASYLELHVDQLLNSWEDSQLGEPETTTPQINVDSQAFNSVQPNPDTSDEKYTEITSEHFIWNEVTNPEPTDFTESQKIFREIGNELSSLREQLSISLQDVEKYTRLKPSQITALESGRIDLIPSPVQAKGMLSNYAGFLQADTEKLLFRFADGLQTQLSEKRDSETDKTSSKQPDVKNLSGWRRLFTLDLVIGSSMILFLLIFSVWGLIQISSSGSEPMDLDAPGIVEMLQVTPSLQPEDSIIETSQVLSESNANQTGEADTPGLINEPIDITETIPASDNSAIQLYIVALQRAYLKVIVDGNTKFDGRIIPGNAYQFSGNDLIELTTGNAAALQVFHNQNNLGSLGFVGEVVKLQFSIFGVITPTPMFTATSTATPVSTVTLQPSPTLVTPTPSATPINP